jgi:hypothetical protein
MRTLVLVLLTALGGVSPVSAQSHVFLTGDVFADLKRFSSTSDGTSPLNGNAVGGGGSVGVIVADRWSLELALEPASSTTRTTPIPIRILLPTPITVVPSRLQSETTTRLFAASTLFGYHWASGHRVRPGVMGGLTFLHARRRETTIALVPPIALPSTVLTDNVPAATVGAEVALQLTSHLEAVPEIRAHTFSLSGGPAGFSLRPGGAVRWTF